jgi:DNA-binding transcriptional LysR family regulator
MEFHIWFLCYNHLRMSKGIDWEAKIGRRLRLRDLHAFFTVVRSGSMAKAAAQLGVSQPAVSKVIGDLEHALGVRLLDRNRRGIAPTIYGEALFKRGLIAFDELKQGVRDIEFLADSTQGEVRIECPETVLSTILPQMIQRFSEKYPRVTLHVDSIVSPTLGLPALRERKYDLMLGWLPRPLPDDFFADDLKVESLLDDRLVIAAGAHNPLAHRRKIDLADLAGEPWILQAPDTWNHTRLAEVFQARGLAMPKSSLVTLSILLRIHFLTSGPHIATIARSLVQRHSLRELPVDLPIWDFPVSIITIGNRTPSPVVERFIECARETGAPMTSRQRVRRI